MNNKNNINNLMEEIFETSNKNFLIRNASLFEQRVSERTLCGALMLELDKVIRKTIFSEYYCDVEYNRNKSGKLKTIKVKTIKNRESIIKINCDLIVHSRGENTALDNLIAIEMKKSTASSRMKYKDKERLECLTADTFDNIWSYDGKKLPENVCRYKLGVYYEINFANKLITLEYYKKGNHFRSYKIDFNGDFIS